MRTVIGKEGGEGITDKENSKQGHCVSAGCYGEDKKILSEAKMGSKAEKAC